MVNLGAFNNTTWMTSFRCNTTSFSDDIGHGFTADIMVMFKTAFSKVFRWQTTSFIEDIAGTSRCKNSETIKMI